MDYSVGQARQASGATAVPVSTFNSQLGALENEIDRMVNLRDSLTAIADRLTGSRPREAGNSEAQLAGQLSVIDELQRKQRRLQRLINECEAERDRIGQAVG